MVNAPTSEKRCGIPLVTLSGHSCREMERFLDNLLVILEEKSIRTLLVAADKEMAGAVCGLPSSGIDILFREGWGLAADREGQPALYHGYDGCYDLILIVENRRQETGTIEILVDAGQQEQRLLHHRHGDDITAIIDAVGVMLKRRIMMTPVWACILIGGYSSRMGRPKHLITTDDGTTWLENLYACFSSLVDQIVLAGRGEIPQSLGHVPRLVDIPEAKGPLAGILAAMRWNPQVSWIVSACDMPAVQAEAVKWLLSTRQPGVWGSVPHHVESGRCEPLLAHYDFRSRCLFENMLREGNYRPSQIVYDSKVSSPAVPRDLAGSWQNCNTPEDLARLSIA